MENINIRLEDIKEAYQKLKTHVYYDSHNLNIRIKLAEFESNNTNESIDKFFDDLLKKINNNNIEDYVKNIKKYILPKKISRRSKNNCDKELDCQNNIVRNDESALSDEIIISDKNYNFYIDAPIELHLLDILWIMKEGCFLIDENIKKDCYGNTLVFEDNDSNKIKSGSYLFERYFDKYQSWRDKGIKIAREQTKHNNDVLLICLDIQRFYPTSQIRFEKIRTKLNELNVSCNLTNLLEKVYIGYQKLLEEKDYSQLPIGLLSSGVIANWYLSDFDVAMKERFNPIYYGRYVDDIFMVLGNVKPECDKNWFKEKFLYDGQPLFIDDKDTETSEKNTDIFYLSTHENLKINKEKIKIFYFAPNHSLAILDNFQKTLDENSSAFWFLPEDDDANDTLNNKGFDIIYNDSINKFREISSVKNNKYGVSIFLTKQIKKEIICRNSDKLRINDELFKYFVGDRLIDMYSLWEKVFTYFIVTNDKKSFIRFEINISKEIEKIKLESSNQDDVKLIKESLHNHCRYCQCMALALNYDVIEDSAKYNDLPKKLRKSYLIRQHYTPFPIIIYTNLDEKNIISPNIYTKLFKSEDLDINRNINTYINPRKIHAHEISMIEIFKYVHSLGGDNKLYSVNKLIREIEEYCPYKSFVHYNDTYISLTNNQTPIVNVPKLEIINKENIIKEKIKIALSNIKVYEEDINNSIRGISILKSNKQQRHYHLLNLATEEKVDCLVLPEVSLPIELLMTYAEHSRRKQQLIIAGLEHIVVNKNSYNLSVVLLPFTYQGNKEVLILPRLKNHYSINESNEILKYKLRIPTSSTANYHLINWRGVQFTVFNCYELANVFHRSLLKSHIDILFAIEYNKDTYYYSNIVEATCRDLHCYFIQANTSDYGDSRVSLPKRHVEMSPVKIKGGENDTIITYTLDIKSLRDFQIQDPLRQDTSIFKNTPPGFDSEKVINRN